MSYGFKIFTWVEDSENLKSDSIDFYKASEVDNYIIAMSAEINRLQKQYNQAVLAANENIANTVDNNAKYWKELCEKRTQMYLDEQARANALGEQLQKEIHKPFPYIEKIKVMKIELLREMAYRARFESISLLRTSEEACNLKTKDKLYKKSIRRYRQEILFFKKADELEKELNE